METCMIESVTAFIAWSLFAAAIGGLAGALLMQRRMNKGG